MELIGSVCDRREPLVRSLPQSETLQRTAAILRHWQARELHAAWVRPSAGTSSTAGTSGTGGGGGGGGRVGRRPFETANTCALLTAIAARQHVRLLRQLTGGSPRLIYPERLDDPDRPTLPS